MNRFKQLKSCKNLRRQSACIEKCKHEVSHMYQSEFNLEIFRGYLKFNIQRQKQQKLTIYDVLRRYHAEAP